MTPPLKRPKVKTTYSADIDTPESSADAIYTVLAKDNFRWRTIVTRTEDIEQARLKMTEASLNPKYEKVIICQAPLSDDSLTFKWETIECAVRPLDNTEIVRTANTVRQNLQCMDTGVCITPSSASSQFGKRMQADNSNEKDQTGWLSLKKRLKKIVDAA